MDPLSVMPFGDHLEDLRKRLIWGITGILPVFIICLIFGGPLLEFLMVPLLDSLRAAGEPTRLLATSPIETFAAYLKVSFIVTLLIATPWIVLQLWLFVSPGLYAQEKRFVYFLIPLSTALTALGMVFLYKVLLPISMFFLISFGISLVETGTPIVPAAESQILASATVLQGDPEDAASLAEGTMWVNEPLGEVRVVLGGRVVGLRLSGGGAIAQQYRIGEYVSLVFMLGLVFAVSFQLPVVLMLLSWAGILRADEITPFRKHVVFGCGVAGAVLTPQDPASMLLLGGALYVLFEFGIVLMRFVPARVIAEGFGTDGQAGDP